MKGEIPCRQVEISKDLQISMPNLSKEFWGEGYLGGRIFGELSDKELVFLATKVKAADRSGRPRDYTSALTMLVQVGKINSNGEKRDAREVVENFAQEGGVFVGLADFQDAVVIRALRGGGLL